MHSYRSANVEYLMDAPRLCTEICEHIMDYVRESSPWWNREEHYFPTLPGKVSISPKDVQTCMRTFSACSLTCSSWLPRARVHLYRIVTLRDTRDVEIFVRTITGTPHLADLVRELVPNVQFYLSFAQGRLVKSLRNLRTLVFPLFKTSGTPWSYPQHYYTYVTQFPFTELVLRMDLTSRDGLRLLCALEIIWTSKSLERLTFEVRGVTPELGDSQLRRMGNLRKRWSGDKLKTLVIKVSPNSVAMLILSQLLNAHIVSGFCIQRRGNHAYPTHSPLRHRGRASRCYL